MDLDQLLKTRWSIPGIIRAIHGLLNMAGASKSKGREWTELQMQPKEQKSSLTAFVDQESDNKVWFWQVDKIEVVAVLNG